MDNSIEKVDWQKTPTFRAAHKFAPVFTSLSQHELADFDRDKVASNFQQSVFYKYDLRLGQSPNLNICNCDWIAMASETNMPASAIHASMSAARKKFVYF
jgi:hypothetical protein